MCFDFGSSSQGLDAGDVLLGNGGDVAGPGFPIGAVADFQHHLGVDGVFPLFQLREGEGALHFPDFGFASRRDVAVLAGFVSGPPDTPMT